LGGAGFIVLGLACALPASSGLANEASASAQTVELRNRLTQLEARNDAKYAKGALEQARRALSAASHDAEHPSTASRARKIAEAAMVLADRQLAHRRAQAELFATQRRLSSSRERANAQRRVLEALMKDRASLAREGERP